MTHLTLVESKRFQSLKVADNLFMKQSMAVQSDRSVVPMSYRILGNTLNMLSMINNEWVSDKLSNLWFRVFKRRMNFRTKQFWRDADRCVEVHYNDKSIPVYLWGQGPLIVLVHGWSGSGIQYRYFIPELVKAGYQVATFDAPAHGLNPGKQAHILDFSDALVSIQRTIGEIDAVIAHSMGAMASVLATHRGLHVKKMILLAPVLDVNHLFERFQKQLNLTQSLSTRFHDKVGVQLNTIMQLDSVWEFLKPDVLLNGLNSSGLIVADTDDKEISNKQLLALHKHWKAVSMIRTSGLGHFKLLKDETVILDVVNFLIHI